MNRNRKRGYFAVLVAIVAASMGAYHMIQLRIDRESAGVVIPSVWEGRPFSEFVEAFGPPGEVVGSGIIIYEYRIYEQNYLVGVSGSQMFSYDNQIIYVTKEP